MAQKLFYSMGEVTEMLDVRPSLIRFWGTKFTCLKPKRNLKGNRMFTPEDVANLKLIYHLVKEKKMTLEGAAKVINTMKLDDSKTSAKISALERLQNIRSILLEIKQNLGCGCDDLEEEQLSTDVEHPLENTSTQDIAFEPESEVLEMKEEDKQQNKEAGDVSGNGSLNIEQSLFKDAELFDF